MSPKTLTISLSRFLFDFRFPAPRTIVEISVNLQRDFYARCEVRVVKCKRMEISGPRFTKLSEQKTNIPAHVISSPRSFFPGGYRMGFIWTAYIACLLDISDLHWCLSCPVRFHRPQPKIHWNDGFKWKVKNCKIPERNAWTLRGEMLPSLQIRFLYILLRIKSFITR